MRNLSIDIETYSGANLSKCGVYRYSEESDFAVLLFGYSVDGADVQVVDLACGEKLPDEIRSALTDDRVTKWAFNAQFERVCLSRFLGMPTGCYLDPGSWRCTMVWAATLGLPLSLEGVGAVLGLEKQKLKEGKDLIRFFSAPGKAKDGTPFRRMPQDAPEKWSRYKAYNLRDVETEMGIQAQLIKFPVSDAEWNNYHLDQRINARGVMLDRTLVSHAIRCDEQFKLSHLEQARFVTGLENPTPRRSKSVAC
jgi:DNA polymerase